MKVAKLPSPRKGLTMIEMLVVIAILATLGSIGYGVIFGRLKQGKIVRAQSVIKSISEGVNGFHSKYGSLPGMQDETGGEDVEFATDDNESIEFLKELLARGGVVNRENKIYIDIDDAGSEEVDGVVWTSSGEPESIIDPFGKPYRIKLDSNYDNEIELSGNFETRNGEKIIRSSKVIIWSAGPDKEFETADDIKSWDSYQE